MDVDSSVHHVHTSHIWALGHKGSNMNPSRSHRNMNHPHHRDQCRLGTGPGYEAERFDALRNKVKRPLYGCDCLWDSTCESGVFKEDSNWELILDTEVMPNGIQRYMINRETPPPNTVCVVRNPNFDQKIK